MKKLDQIKDKITTGLNFVLDGDLVVYVSNRILLTSGRIAESALMIAVLWLTAHYIARSFLETIFSSQILSTCDAFAILSMTLLPEVILYSAITITVRHAILAFKSKKIVSVETLWSCLYGLPTVSFTFMTLSVFWFVAFDSKALSVSIQADSLTMFIRFVSSWSYFLISLLYMKTSDGKFLGETETKDEVIIKTKVMRQKKTLVIPETETKLISEKSETKQEENNEVENFESSETKILEFTGKTQDKVNNYLLSLSQEEQIYYWNNRDELSQKLETSKKTIERAYASICPESKVRVK